MLARITRFLEKKNVIYLNTSPERITRITIPIPSIDKFDNSGSILPNTEPTNSTK